MANEDLIISVKVENGKESVKLLQSVGQVVKQIDKDSDKLSAKLNKAMSALSQEIRVLSAATDLNAKYAISQQKVAQEIEKTATIRESYVNKQIKNAKLQDSLIQQQAIGQQKLQQEINKTATSMQNTEKAVWNNVRAEIQAESANIRLNKQMKNLNSETSKATNIFNNFGIAANVAIGNLSSAAINNFINRIKDLVSNISQAGVAMDGIRNTFAAGARSWKQGGEEMKFVADMANRLGLNLEATYEPYAKFMTSFTRSGGTIAQSRQIFEDLSTAMVSLHLPATQMESVFVALEQMANKGTVQSEELKRQLGNALPGAFELAAQSMGITANELMDLMKKGEVLSKDFLPKFAETVKDSLGNQIGIAVNQYNAHLNRMNTQTWLLQASIGQAWNTALIPLIEFATKGLTILNGFTNALSNTAIGATAFQLGLVALTTASVAGLSKIAALSGVIKVLGTDLRVLQRWFMATQVSAINLNAVLNASVWIALAAGILYCVNAANQAEQSFAEMAAQQRDVSNNVTGLISEFDALSKVEQKTTVQQEAYNRTLQELSSQYPEILKYIQENSISLSTLTQEQANNIASMAVMSEAQKAQAMMTQELGNEWIRFKNIMLAVWNTIKAVVGSVMGIVAAAFTAVADTFDIVQNKLDLGIGKLTSGMGKLLSLTGFKKLGEEWQKTGKEISGLANATAKGYQTTSSIIKGTIDLWKQIPEPFDNSKIKAAQRYNDTIVTLGQNQQKLAESLMYASKASVGLEKPEAKTKSGRTAGSAKTKSPTEAKTEWDKLTKEISKQENQIKSLDKAGQRNTETYKKLTAEYQKNVALKEAIEKHTASLIEKQKTEADMWSKIKKSAEDTSKTYEYMTYNSQNYTQSEIDKARELAKGYNAVVKYSESLKNNNDLMKITSRTARDLTNTLVDGLFEPLKEGESIWTKFKDAGISAIKAIATEWVKNKINLVLTGAQAGWGVGTIGGGSFTDKAKMAGIGAMTGINNLPLFGTRDNNLFAQATGGLSQVYDNFLEKIGANNVTDTVFTELAGQATGLTNTLVSTTTPVMNETVGLLGNMAGKASETAQNLGGIVSPATTVAQSIVSMATAAPIAVSGVGALAGVMTISSKAFIKAAPALTQMATAMTTLATSAAQAAISMANLAIATAAQSVAKIPFVGGFLAPLAATATGAAIGLGTTMAGAGIAAGASMAGAGQMVGGTLTGIGNKFAGLGGGSKVVKHAKGGVVSSPTMFPMQGGNIGVAGEAGTEVIAPARRMANGDLGIGAVQPQVTVNNYTNAAVEVIKRPNNEMEIKITELNAMLSSSRSNKGMMAAQNRMDTRGRRIG